MVGDINMNRINDSGSWKPARSYNYNNSGAWTEGDLWTNVGGVWRQLVPPNCVVLYDTIPTKAFLANGTNATPNLLDTSILGSSTFGTAGGNLYHGNHGSSALVNTSTNNHGTYGTGLNVKYFYDTGSSHYHQIPAHEHPNQGDNLAGINRKSLMPYMYGPTLEVGAHVLGRDLGTTLFTEIVYAVEKYYLWLASSASEMAGTSSHNHGTSTLPNVIHNATVYRVKSYDNNGTWYGYHEHSVNHTQNDIRPEPSYYNTGLWKVNNPIYFDELPIGSIMLFSSTHLPKGWTRNTDFDNRLISFFSSDGTGGTETHIHGDKTVTTSTMLNVSGARAYHTATSGTKGQVIVNHSHTFVDTHSTEENHMPPYIHFIIGEKTT